MYHWNGSTWTRYPMPAGPPGVLANMVALGPDDVWAAGYGGGSSFPPHPPAPAVVHWDGRTWTSVALPVTLGFVTGITGDGAGGVWAAVTDDQHQTSPYLRWNAGTWTTYSSPPALSGTAADSAVARVPGTRQVWSGGVLRSGAQYAANLEMYVPTVRP
jgi:hypothetical protein